MRNDFIELNGLTVFANHGVLDEEKKNGQNFFVDIRMYFDLSKAGKSDDLNKTVNYAELAVLVNDFMKNNTFNLIETVAEKLADEILHKYSLIEKVDLSIHKPEAPIPLEFGDVSVNITRQWSEVYLSVGSNIGDKEKYIREAVSKLAECKDIRDVVCSNLITTKPYGGVEQDDFVNGAIALKTLYSPYELLDFLHEIEKEAKRERKIHWGPRTLDLDIVFYDDLVMSKEDLTVPHIDMQNRNFVLEPLKELCPYYIHPVLGKSVLSLYNELDSKQLI